MYLPESQYLDVNTIRNFDILSAFDEKRIIASKAYSIDDSGIVVILHGKRCVIPADEYSFDTPKESIMFHHVGRMICFIVKEIVGEDDCYAILSRKDVQRMYHRDVLDSIEAGTVLPGTVICPKQYGVFVDIGCGCTALLPTKMVCVNRICNIETMLPPEKEIFVAAHSRNERGQLIVTMRELLGDWGQNVYAYHEGRFCVGMVTAIYDYGVFVQLTPNLAALADYVPWVNVGDCVKMYISRIRPDKLKIKGNIINYADHFRDVNKLVFRIVDGRISKWRYSPKDCLKVVETDFESNPIPEIENQ